MTRAERIAGFADAIWSWYARHKRSLPWRDLPDQDPNIRAYKILVSEVMLQQTQVSRVQIVFKRFLERFPTMKSLAEASNREVILAWRGMGYNSRALRLRDAIRTVVDEHYGVFPITMKGLRDLPGLGNYTAAAVRNFAWNLPTPCTDTNIRRILHRTFFGPENADGTWEVGDAKLLKLAAEVLNIAVELQIANCKLQINRPAADWHAALMDFGSMVQTKRNPKWSICPLTAAGIMKTTAKNFPKSDVRSPKSEPGRIIAGRFTPNRIIRGRVVELLRDSPKPLTLASIGKDVCIDWSKEEHAQWMQALLKKLQSDGLLVARSGKFSLAE